MPAGVEAGVLRAREAVLTPDVARPRRISLPEPLSLPQARPLRVLHVAEAFGGGLLEVVRFLCERHVAGGHEVSIAYGTRPETPDDPAGVFGDRVELFDLGWHRGTPTTHLEARRRVQALCRRMRPDVVHLHSSFAGFVTARSWGDVPTIFTPHAFASCIGDVGRLRRAMYTTAERVAVRSCDVVAAVSESEAATAQRLGARSVVSIPNGIPELDPMTLLAGTPPARPGNSSPLAIGVGRLSAQRRPEACARILSRLSDLARVAWVGGERPGAAASASRATVEGLGVPVSGWRPRDEVMAAMREAHVYVHWTSWDGMPVSVLEAMSTDTVVIASDTEPNREVLGERQVCRTEAEAVELGRAVLSDADFAMELLRDQEARRLRHSADVMARAYERLYRRLADGSRIAA
jgi:glycosyltransferase involved in cell wall biosynthesis